MHTLKTLLFACLCRRATIIEWTLEALSHSTEKKKKKIYACYVHFPVMAFNSLEMSLNRVIEQDRKAGTHLGRQNKI